MHRIGAFLLQKQEIVAVCQELASRCVIIVDASLEKTVGKALYQNFSGEVDLLAIPGGEGSKTREMKARIEDTLLDWGALRDTCLLAVGGGALLDLVGFVAATYCRGIPYVSCPSTLLAMTDASIGGKTGINHPKGKNLIGAFYPPEHVFCDLALLETLPPKEWLWGLAETIKHALIGSRPLFTLLEQEWERVLRREQALIGPMIEASIAVKQRLVERDPYDQKGLRVLLNFGHTVGHALEASNGFRIHHGKAVAIGMLVEARLAYQKGWLDPGDYHRVEALLSRLPLPLDLRLDPAALRFDKKGKELVALTAIGAARLQPYQLNELREAWHATMRGHQNA